MEENTDLSEVQIFHLRVPADLARRIDQIAAQRCESMGGTSPNRSEVARMLLKLGADDYERRV